MLTEQKLKPEPKMTLSAICYCFDFCSRQGKNRRADLVYLKESLEHKKEYLKKHYKFDLDNHPPKKRLPYSVIGFIFKTLQP